VLGVTVNLLTQNWGVQILNNEHSKHSFIIICNIVSLPKPDNSLRKMRHNLLRIFVHLALRELNTNRPTIVFFLGPTKPLLSYD
jgi:hypothetical protein